MIKNTDSLTKLANEFGSAKGTTNGLKHAYTVLYDSLFSGARSAENLNILELGLAEGGPEVGGSSDRRITGAPSVDMWLGFFPNAQVVGFDISEFSHLQNEQFTFVRGDSGVKEDVQKIASLNRQFDIVVDDASHASFHQQLAIAELYSLVRPGGFYIIEDLNWVPEEYERTLPKVPLTRNWLMDFINSSRLATTAAISNEETKAIMDQTMSVQMYDEYFLDSLGRVYNARFEPDVSLGRSWRRKSVFGRLIDPYFVKFCLRRIMSAFQNEEFVVKQNVKLAVLQKKF